MNNQSNNSYKNALLLLGGALCGAAATYYLNTKSGRKMLREVSQKVSDISSNLKDNVSAVSDEVINQAHNMAEMAETKLTQIKETAADKIGQLESTADRNMDNAEAKSESKLSNFQKGVERAKKKLDYSHSEN